MNITEKALIGPKGQTIKIAKTLEYPPRQQIYIEFKEKLRKKSNYTLNMRWYSRLVEEPEGFYIDEYDNGNGVKRLLAAAVLGPGTARRAFPCFDEPHLRAPFRISLFRDRFHIGLSNSIVHTTDDVGFYMGTGLLRDDFVETPPLPPDSVSWVISDFRRNILEPSPTYHVMVTTTTTQKPHADNQAAKLKSDKRPFRNLTAVIISKGLFKLTNSQPETTTHTSIINGNGHSNGNLTEKINQGNNTNQSNSSHSSFTESLEIKTAPSYSFYASKDYVDKGNFLRSFFQMCVVIYSSCFFRLGVLW